MEAVWKTVRSKLMVANGDEFERLALHYLRVIWPTMIQAPRMQRLDRYGVDLCVPDSDRSFKVVVQTKGLKVDDQLLESQVRRQILPSIRKYRESPLVCDQYILLHNRDGRNREFAAEIEAALDQLVQDGKARSGHLWDRFTFVKHVRKHMDRRIREKLSERSRRVLRQQESFFHFGDQFVSHVPLSRSIWKPDSPLGSDFDGLFTDTNAAKLIASPRKVRYALLIGSFGIGKTTTVLHAAEEKGLVVVYVPAHVIQRPHGSQGTNFLLRNVDVELNLLDDLPGDTSEVLHDVLGAALGRILRQPNDVFLLVIDGLDEHGFYGTPHGLQWLTNELAELRCPIVLTTRREHFLSLIGNYKLAAESLSRKGGANRIVEVFQLGAWSPVQARALLQRAIEATKDKAHGVRIRQLHDELTSTNSHLAKRLLSHPLFLQVTLDLIVDGEEWILDNDDNLMELWARKKIERDLCRPRLNQNTPFDVSEYVEGMMVAMEHIAQEMQPKDPDAATAETIDAAKVIAIVENAMELHLDIGTILTTSLLVPVRERRGRVLEVKFFHRALQEFFARRAVAAHHGRSNNGLQGDAQVPRA